MPILILVDVQVISFVGMSVGELLMKRTLPWTCVLLCFSVTQLKKNAEHNSAIIFRECGGCVPPFKEGAHVEMAPLSV